MTLDNPLDGGQDIRQSASASIVEGLQRHDLSLLRHTVGRASSQGSNKGAVSIPVCIVIAEPLSKDWSVLGPTLKVLVVDIDTTNKE